MPSLYTQSSVYNELYQTFTPDYFDNRQNIISTFFAWDSNTYSFVYTEQGYTEFSSNLLDKEFSNNVL